MSFKGGTNSEGETSNQLKNAQINIYTNDFCKAISREENKNMHICAGDLINKIDVCAGDSGGSLYVKEKINGKEKLVSAGIVSFGPQCGQFDNPG